MKLSIAAIGLIVLTGLLGCDTTGLQNSIDDFGLVIGLEPINTGATVLVTDAVTGELIDATISINFDGQNGPDVIDMYSDPVSEDETSSGILNFAIANTIVPTNASPAKVQLRMQAPGYATTIKTVELTEIGFDDFSFTMLSNSNKPASIKTTTGTGTTAADGSTTASVEISTNAGQSSEDSTSVEFDEGTVFTDENGSTLTGALNIEMTSFDLSNPTAVQNLPFDMEDVTEDGEDTPTILGVNVLTITDGQGKVAAKAFVPAAKSKQLSHGITSLFLTAPNRVPVISLFGFSLSRGKSTPLPGTPVGVSGSNYTATTSSDARGVVITNSGGTKTYSSLVIEGNGYEGTLKYTVNSKGRSENGSAPISSSSVAKNIVFNKNSDSFSVKITSPVETELSYNTLPEGDTFTITLPQKPSNLISSTVNVELRCSDPDEKVGITNIPQASVVFRKAGSTNKWRVISKVNWDYDEGSQTLTGGTFNISAVEQGVDYNFKITYDGNVESKIITINGTNVSTVISEEIDSICS